MQGSDDPRAAVTRREFLGRSAVGGAGLLLAYTIAGREVLAAPAEARAAGAPLKFLDATEAETLERIGEALVPGSAAAGLVHYLDHQLAGPVPDCMLMAKYIGLAPPLAPFYRAAIGATRAALARYDADPAHGADRARSAAALAAAMLPGKVEGWEGPPSGLVCFVLRTDAIDVVYGTPEGFETLGVPYMAHIHPASRWGE